MNIKRNSFTFILLTLVVMAGAGCASGGDPKIAVKGVTIEPSSMLKGVGSSFMFIVNDGKSDDALKGCSIKEYPSAHVMLHDFENGKMIMVQEIKAPAGKTTELKKGGLHIMFSGLPEQLDEQVTLVLDFEKTGSIEVTAKRRDRQTMAKKPVF